MPLAADRTDMPAAQRGAARPEGQAGLSGSCFFACQPRPGCAPHVARGPCVLPACTAFTLHDVGMAWHGKNGAWASAALPPIFLPRQCVCGVVARCSSTLLSSLCGAYWLDPANGDVLSEAQCAASPPPPSPKAAAVCKPRLADCSMKVGRRPHAARSAVRCSAPSVQCGADEPMEMVAGPPPHCTACCGP